jgi:hypothetical protein
LAKRLGYGILVDSAYDDAGRIVFMLSGAGTVYMYKVMHDSDVRFVGEKGFDGKATKILYEGGNLLLMGDDRLEIYKLK